MNNLTGASHGSIGTATGWLLSPGTNVNGVVILGLGLSTGGRAVIHVTSGVPGAYDDASNPWLASGGTTGAAALALPIILPPGQGLYFYATSATSEAWAVYKVL